MKSTLKLEPHATDSYQNMLLTLPLTKTPLMFVTKLLPTPKDYLLMLKNNLLPHLPNSTVSTPEWLLVPLKE
jgi:hypothetical protein